MACRIFFTGHPSPTGVKGNIIKPGGTIKAPGGTALSSSSIQEGWKCWRYFGTLGKIRTTILCRTSGQL